MVMILSPRFFSFVLVIGVVVHGWSQHAPSHRASSSFLDRRQALASVLVAGWTVATPPAFAATATIDVNNALAREFTAFPGLYPTIATKIVLAAKDQAFTSKKDVYNALSSDMERDRLRQYDKSILIRKPDAALQQFKTSQICKYECGNRVSNSYRDEQIRAVQAGRR